MRASGQVQRQNILRDVRSILGQYIRALEGARHNLNAIIWGSVSTFGLHSLVFLVAVISLCLGYLIVLGSSLSSSELIVICASVMGTSSLISMTIWFAESYRLGNHKCNDQDSYEHGEKTLAGTKSSFGSANAPRAYASSHNSLANDAIESQKRFELAMKNSNISVFHHDLAHRCTWSYNCKVSSDKLLGRTDYEVMSESAARILTKLKSEALANPGVKEAVISIEDGEEVSWYLVKTVRNRGQCGSLLGTTSVSFDITEVKRREEKLMLITREMTHRSGNLLSIISGIAQRAASTATDVEDLIETLVNKMQALSKAHNLILQAEWSTVRLGTLIDRQLSCYDSKKGDAIRVKGPEVELKPKAVQMLGLALNELATNASKYGALTAAKGHVLISSELRRLDGQLQLVLSWRESGGPEVRGPQRSGFGSFILERVVASDLNAATFLTYKPSGLQWKLILNEQYFQPLNTSIQEIERSSN